jgi:hypothetical protein
MLLKTFIKEVIEGEKRRLRESASSKEFSLETLKACTFPEQAMEYLDTHLEKAGAGFYRVVYGLDDQRVIKFSYDTTQNSQEVRNSRCLPSKYVIQVLDKHPEFWWIVVERVQKLSIGEFIAEFEKHAGAPVIYTSDGRGYDLEQKTTAIMAAIEFGTQTQHPFMQAETEVKKNNEQWMKSKWYAGLIAALRKCQVVADDFHSKNWGIRPSTGQLVLLDLGF